MYKNYTTQGGFIMDQNMITVTTDIQISEERLKEIFEVPKTKQLFDEFMAKEETLEALKDLTETLEQIIMGWDPDEEQMPEAKEVVIDKIKTAILTQSIDLVLDGKSLNQAIQITIKNQIKQSNVFEIISKSLCEMMADDRPLLLPLLVSLLI